MKPVIYYIEEQIHQTGSRIIKRLSDKLLNEEEEFGFKNKLTGHTGNYVKIYKNEHLTVGLFCHEDIRFSPSKLILDMENEGCDLVFCTSIIPEAISIAHGALPFSKYELRQSNTIFSPMIDLETLIDYRSEKLAERVQFAIEDRKDEDANNMRLRSMVI